MSAAVSAVLSFLKMVMSSVLEICFAFLQVWLS